MIHTELQNDKEAVREAAVTVGAIALLVERYATQRQDSNSKAAGSKNYYAKVSGTDCAAMVNTLFENWVSTQEHLPIRTVISGETPWRQWALGNYHLRITRGAPNSTSNTAAAFKAGKNTLQYCADPFDDEVFTEVLDGRPSVTDPINLYIRFDPTTSGSILRIRYETTGQSAENSFSEEIPLLEALELSQQFEQERPEWLELLYTTYNQQAEASSDTSVFSPDSLPQVAPTEAPASEQEHSEEDLQNGEASA